jgi:hypothetical protein
MRDADGVVGLGGMGRRICEASRPALVRVREEEGNGAVTTIQTMVEVKM